MIWNQEPKDIIKKFNSNAHTGLDQGQVVKLQKSNGLNVLPVAQKKPWWKIVFEHFIDPFMLVLIALLIVVCILQEWSEVVVIFLIIVLQTLLSSYQEIKAAASLESLKKLVKEQAVIIRDGKKITIDVKQLVVGDLVVLEAGMFVPADLRVIEAFNLRMNEALLTGESNPTPKTTAAIAKTELAIADRSNMAFMSTTVVMGSGKAIVVATGAHTEIGKINELLQTEEEPPSHLNQQISFLIRVVSVIAVLLGISLFLIEYFISRTSAVDGVLIAIALVVAVIPEGLLIIITVCLSLGSRRMAKKHAIVKRLSAVETLGQVNVICSDKTGTLTQNKMTVQKFYLKKSVQTDQSFVFDSLQSQLFMNCLILANNSTINGTELIGDPTETALLSWAQKIGLNCNLIHQEFKRIHELPFDSDRKLMSTINHYEDEKYLFIKGAPDNLIERCTHILIGNRRVKINDQVRNKITKVIKKMSNSALRVLGTAYRVVKDDHDFNDLNFMEHNLTFLGLVGMMDPPRTEVKMVLKKTKAAGIVTKMITGDHLNTAIAIARELKIINHKKQAISGETIAAMSDRELAKKINRFHVFARVSPEHKVRIVKALQANNKIVSMTGDGVNDAPSLKAANIGIAMGITGTDVAKEAAQMVLTDDNFLTIVDAIEEGRNIYNKLKRIMCFILITNFSQALAVILGAAFQIGELLTPLQILWINLIVESILAITMSMAINNPKLMNDKPVKPDDNVLTGSWIFIIGISVVLSAVILLAALYLPKIFDYPPATAKGYSFIIMVNAPIFYSISFSLGRHSTIFNKMIFKNWVFLIAVAVSFLLNVLIVYTPFIKDVFGITLGSVGVLHWFYCLLIALIPTVIIELSRLMMTVINKIKKH